MCESSRKSYIIVLSRKLSIFETLLWIQSCLESKNNKRSVQYSPEDVWVTQKKLHHCDFSETIIKLLWRQKLFTIKKQFLKKNNVHHRMYESSIQKELHYHAISETIDFWDLIMKTKVVQNQITTKTDFQSSS